MMGVIRTDAELRALEAEHLERFNCAAVQRGCEGFFERRGLKINNPPEAPPWDQEWIEREFGDPVGTLRAL